MGEHAAFLDRMTARLAALEHEVEAWCTRSDDRRAVRDLQARLAILKERLQVVRRAGTDATAEMTQVFARSFERFRLDLVKLRATKHRAA